MVPTTPPRLPARVAALLLACWPSATAAQAAACPKALTPSYPAPVLGAGWTAQLVATGLSNPRGLVLDSGGGLLVVESGRGIRRFTFKDDGNGSAGCFGVDKKQTVVELSELNHGIDVSEDGKTLYASSADSVYSWEYDASQGSARPDSRKTLVGGMASTDHVSRTVVLSRKSKGVMLVHRGSASNMDANARDKASGVSQIRAFDLNSLPDGGRRAYRYASEGRLVGWGLRNSVGVAEHPVTGGVYSVENSADDVRRMGVDVHRDNPGEEMNFHGTVSSPAGANHGYPDCFALWDTDVPQGSGMRTGSQFALGAAGGSTVTDADCASANYTAPRLTFQAHMAPLDLKFSADGAEAYVAFHGSWNRDDPVGYKISMIKFANGEPTEPADSRSSTVDIMSNPDLSACPGRCFRPVGLALDQKGRMYMTSDETGEIYLLRKSEMAATDSGRNGGRGGNSAGHLATTNFLGSMCLMLFFLCFGRWWW